MSFTKIMILQLNRKILHKRNGNVQNYDGKTKWVNFD